MAAAPAAERPPNIVLILADDLGFNDISFNGGGLAGGSVATPRIDSIGQQGVAFLNGYAGNATCAPSRAAIITGRYATRSGFEFTPTPVDFSRLIASFTEGGPHPSIFYEDRLAGVPDDLDELALPEGEITIAELLKPHGYHSVMLGKWHLGGTDSSRPDAQGFDEYLGFHPGAALFLPVDDPGTVNSRQDFDPIDKFLWANLAFAVRYNNGPRFAPDRYMTDYLAEHAVQVIEANRNRPFFLFLSFNAPHTPLQATREDYEALGHIEDHATRVYAGMIRALDRGVGRVLEALAEQGLEENTLVVFSSDNGGAHYIGIPGINDPYRGWKASFFEGGIRTPFFARWPARIPAGSRYEQPIGHVDIFAAAAAAAGAALPSDRIVDGVDFVPYVRGEAQGRPHEALFWRSGHYRALLSDGWKLQLSEVPERRERLYNLNADPTERRDLAGAERERLQQMRVRLDRINAEQSKPLWPSLIDVMVPIDRTLDAPASEDEEYVYWSN